VKGCKKVTRETWKPVVGYEGIYEVSDCGRVRRIGRYGGAVVGRILRPWKTSKGYLMVSMYDGFNHKVNKRIHRLVARAFIGPPPVGKPEIRHLDGNPHNNHVGNLAWGDNLDNKADIVRHGRSVCPKNPASGEEHGCSKLTARDVTEIRKLLKTHTQVSIARKFNVVQSTISAIKRRKLWKGHNDE